jgi:hypothetical protein
MLTRNGKEQKKTKEIKILPKYVNLENFENKITIIILANIFNEAHKILADS